MIHGIRIKDTISGRLSVDLHSLLQEIAAEGRELHWSITYLDAVGQWNGKSILEIENEVAENPMGLLLKWDELLDFSNSLEYINDADIVGFRLPNIPLKGEPRDISINSDIFISYIDSSYVELYSNNKLIIDLASIKYKNIVFL